MEADDGNRLTRPQQAAVTKVDNIIGNHAKPHDFDGVTKELNGEYTGYNHVEEMENSVRGLEAATESIQGSLLNPHLHSAARKTLEYALERGQLTLRQMQQSLSAKG